VVSSYEVIHLLYFRGSESKGSELKICAFGLFDDHLEMHTKEIGGRESAGAKRLRLIRIAEGEPIRPAGPSA